MKRRSLVLGSILAAGAVLALLAGAAALAGSLLLRQNHRSPIPPPGPGVEEVRFTASDGVRLGGWWWPGRDPRQAVLLLHGLRADRLQMLPRARWLHRLGYSVFLIDFRGCGESAGFVTFGYRERLDVEAALGVLRREKRVSGTVILGESLGADAAMMAADGWGEEVKGAVLESPFDTFTGALRARVRRYAGFLEPVVSPLLLAQVGPRLGFRPEDLAPVKAIRGAHCPVLLGYGGRDPLVDERRIGELFRAAPYPATLWVLQNAGSGDLFRFAPKAYREKVGDFIKKALGSPGEETKG